MKLDSDDLTLLGLFLMTSGVAIAVRPFLIYRSVRAETVPPTPRSRAMIGLGAVVALSGSILFVWALMHPF